MTSAQKCSCIWKAAASCVLVASLVGCGDRPSKDNPSENAHASSAKPVDAPAPPSSDTPANGGDEDAASAASSDYPSPADSGATEDALPEDPFREEEAPNTDEIEATLRTIRELRRQAEFHKAQVLAHKAYGRYKDNLGDTDPFRELRALRAQVARENRRAMRLRTAYRDLGSEEPRRRNVAVDMLRQAGDVGGIFLRKAVRTGDARAALTAARALVNAPKPDQENLLAILARVERSTDAEFARDLFDFVRPHAESLPVDPVVSFARDAGKPEAPPHLARPARSLLYAVSKARELPTERLKKMLEEVAQDENFSKRFLADYLATVYHSRASRDEEAFDKMLDREGAIDALREYGEAAQASERERIREWGELFAAQVTDLITEGLVIMAPAETEPVNAALNPVSAHTSKGATITADGASGEAYAFAGTNGEGKNAVSFGVQDALDGKSAFTIALWFYRTKDRGDQTNHRIHNVMVAHSSDHENDNFELGSHRANLDLYIDTPSTDNDFSFEAGIQNETWTHVAVAYDATQKPPATVYVNGEPVQSELPWRGPLDRASESPLTLGNSFHHETPFVGRIDEFHLYERALTKEEINVLFRRVLPPDPQ